MKSCYWLVNAVSVLMGIIQQHQNGCFPWAQLAYYFVGLIDPVVGHVQCRTLL
jgi:hypothetical protein